MVSRLEVYKCDVCGIISDILHDGKGQLICCGKPMRHMKENTVDAAVEKHVPVIEKTENGVKVKVGSVAHPMQEDHYIEWIELVDDDNLYRKYLNPGQAPEAEFSVTSNSFYVREYCNLHGLWKADA